MSFGEKLHEYQIFGYYKNYFKRSELVTFNAHSTSLLVNDSLDRRFS